MGRGARMAQVRARGGQLPLNPEVTRSRPWNDLIVTAQNATGQPSFTVTRIWFVATFALPAGSSPATARLRRDTASRQTQSASSGRALWSCGWMHAAQRQGCRTTVGRCSGPARWRHTDDFGGKQLKILLRNHEAATEPGHHSPRASSSDALCQHRTLSVLTYRPPELGRSRC